MRGGPFPTLRVMWDKQKIAITAGEVGRKMLDGEPRIMTHAAGEGNSFLIRPVAMKPGDYKIVADRLFQVLSSAAGGSAGRREQPVAPPTANISGVWDVEIEYEVGTARHKLLLAAEGNEITGTHRGWAYEGDLKGRLDGARLKFQSTLPADGNVLTYAFTGSVSGSEMKGDLQIGEYGRARWRAVHHTPKPVQQV